MAAIPGRLSKKRADTAEFESRGIPEGHDLISPRTAAQSQRSGSLGEANSIADDRENGLVPI
jgi:hypothetical protein